MGGPDMAPQPPPNARSTPAKPWRSSTLRQAPTPWAASDHPAARPPRLAPSAVALVNRAEGPPDPPPPAPPLRGELRHELLDQVRRDREADRDGARRHAVAAAPLARHVHERAAGVPRVDRGVGLDEVEAGRRDREGRALAADDAERHTLLQAERVAERQDELADPQTVRVAERQHGEVRGAVDPDQGEVHAVVAPHEAPGVAPSVGEPHLDLLGALDHVGVRHDEPAPVDDEARAGRAPWLVLLLPPRLASRRAADGHVHEPRLSPRRPG